MKKSKLNLFLCIALSMCLLSALVTSFIQSDCWTAKVTDYKLTLKEMADVIRENNSATGKDIKIDFTEDNSSIFHFRLFVPKGVSSDSPVPAVVCAHGGDNTLEAQRPFYIELVRRGYVVIAMDMAGHGESDNAIFDYTAESYGMLAAVEYLMSQPYVDETQIGVTGQSMGNLCSVNTLKVLNTADSTQRVKAWVEGDGTLYAFSLTPELAEGLIMTMNVGRHSEMDIVYVGAYDFLGTDRAKTVLKNFYPEFDEARVTGGQWYSADGEIANAAPGEKLNADSAFRLYNSNNTHPGYHFSLTCTAIAIDGFYAAFGTPANSKFIAPSNQVWPVVEAFGAIGYIGFCLTILAVAALLAKTKLFSGISRPISEADALPSFKSPKEWIISLCTIVILVFVCFKAYIKLYSLGGTIFDATAYPANVPNSMALWTGFCGLFVLFMLGLNYLAKRLVYKKTDIEVANPFTVAKLDSVSQFFLTVFYAMTVVVLAYIPVIIADEVFLADFRITTMAVQPTNIDKLFIVITKYLPFYLLFYIPNAIFNANTRYKDLPEWVSSLICAIANVMPLIITIIIQYGSIVGKGEVPYAAMAGIMACISSAYLLFTGFSARYIYKKTGNIWAAGMINATIGCLLTLLSAWIKTDLMFIF